MELVLALTIKRIDMSTMKSVDVANETKTELCHSNCIVDSTLGGLRRGQGRTLAIHC
jgi:hypothetical protein